MFDQRSQKDLSEGRANAWVEQLTAEGFFTVGGDEKPGDNKNSGNGSGSGSDESGGGGLTGGALVGVILACTLLPVLALSAYNHYKRVQFEKHEESLSAEDQGTPYNQLLTEAL